MNDVLLTFKQPCLESPKETHDLTFDVMPDGRLLVTAKSHYIRRQWMLSEEQRHELIAYLGRDFQ